MLDKIGTEINSYAKMFPVESSLANFTIFINNGQKKIESYYPQIDQLDFYRFVHYVCTCIQIVTTKICQNVGKTIPSGSKNLAPTKD